MQVLVRLPRATTYAYDGIGRLTSLQHAQGVTSLSGYDYSYDNASRITAIDSVLDGLTSYTNDHTGQLTAADHTGQTDESYDYDENGNRTSYTIGDNNQILSDGTYDYEYDDEGNMVAKETIATGVREEYVWDHRNRLVSVVTKSALGAVTKQVDQSYDVFQRWVRRSVDADGAGIAAATDTFFGYEGNQIVLAFDGDDDTDLTNRYLWGEMVDQILADEQITSLSSAGDVIYPLTDHLNTTRDLATYNAGTDITTNANHRRFDSFGNIVSQSNGSVTILVGFTARPFDKSTGLQWNLNRWYISSIGVWMSEDPIGFLAGDENVRRYVGNASTMYSDPSGLSPPAFAIPPSTVGGGHAHDYIQSIPNQTIAERIETLLLSRLIGATLTLTSITQISKKFNDKVEWYDHHYEIAAKFGPSMEIEYRKFAMELYSQHKLTSEWQPFTATRDAGKWGFGERQALKI